MREGLNRIAISVALFALLAACGPGDRSPNSASPARTEAGPAITDAGLSSADRAYIDATTAEWCRAGTTSSDANDEAIADSLADRATTEAVALALNAYFDMRQAGLCAPTAPSEDLIDVDTTGCGLHDQITGSVVNHNDQAVDVTLRQSLVTTDGVRVSDALVYVDSVAPGQTALWSSYLADADAGRAMDAKCKVEVESVRAA